MKYKFLNLVQLLAQLSPLTSCRFYYVFDIIYYPELKTLYGNKLVKFEERLEDKESNPPPKMGNFIMCGYTRKNFEDPLKGVKLVHVGTDEGFSPENIVFIGEESSGDKSRLKGQRFVEAFKKIISNKVLLPDKSCILLNNEHFLLLKSGSNKLKSQFPISSICKKRQAVSQVMSSIRFNHHPRFRAKSWTLVLLDFFA